jgi:hypothetical protein
MKRLIQLNLLLLLISSAGAQESRPQEITKTLHVYDWKDLVQQHEVSTGEVISMDGISVLKIENNNNTPLEVSLLKISDPAVIKKTYFLVCEVKYDIRAGRLQLLSHFPPAVSGGKERVSTIDGWGNPYGVALQNATNQFYSDYEVSPNFFGESGWRPCRLEVDHNAFEGLPEQLEVRLSLWGHGTVYLRPIKLLAVSGSWWSAKQGAMVGGAVGIFGGIIGCFGGLLGCLAGFGKARKFVLTTTKILIALGMLLTITGIVAILCGQPYFVWYVFLLSGVILTLVFSLNFPTIQKRYDDLEIRRMASLDV